MRDDNGHANIKIKARAEVALCSSKIVESGQEIKPDYVSGNILNR